MKKWTKILLACCTCAFALFPFTACDKVVNMTDEEVATMNGAVVQTANYNNSYSIYETSITTSKAEGQLLASATVTADVSYNHTTGNFYYGGEMFGSLGEVQVWFFTAKNDDNTYTQYNNIEVLGRKFATAEDVLTQGYTYANSTGVEVGLYYPSFAGAMETFFLVDLNEASEITSAVEYSNFWVESYQVLIDSLATQYGYSSVNYQMGGSKCEAKENSTVYSFAFTGKAKGKGFISGLPISNFLLKTTVQITVEDSRISQISCNITQKYKVAGCQYTTESAITDDFTYAYKYELEPDITGFPVEDMRADSPETGI